MPRRVLVAVAYGVALTMMGGCGTHAAPVTAQSSLTEGKRLASLVIHAPSGYASDSAQGANGSMTPQLFTADGGAGDATKAGFVAGFVQNYENSTTGEGLAITVIEFSSSADAAHYLALSAPHTLQSAGAKLTKYPDIPGALLATGTRLDQGDGAHAVLWSKGRYYVSMAYLTTGNGSLPFEFGQWAHAQDDRL